MQNLLSHIIFPKGKGIKKTYKAFTLVELIVVITILAILGTIAFISFQGYSKDARDGQRISDLNNIKKSLELFVLEKGFYPIPDNAVNITYSGATAWKQGTLGDNVTKNLQKLSEKPIDPLTQNEYTYSVTGVGTEYQLGAILEGGGGLLSSTILQQTHAATEQKINAMITGTYNEKILRVQSGTNDYILAIPSIINSDVTDTDLLSIINKKQLVYNNYTNLPNSYKNKGYTMTGGFDFIPSGNVEVYSGSVNALTNSGTIQTQFISNLQTAYNGTIIEAQTEINDILTKTTDNEKQILVSNYLMSGVGGLPKVVQTTTIQTQGQTTQWKDVDINCTIDDIIIGTQIWAGCNSTLGTGFEWGKKDDGTNGTILNCWNYDLVENASDPDCTIGNPIMASNISAKMFFDLKQPDGTNGYGDSEYDTIWGKLYTWLNAPSACPTGWHLPSDNEFEILETTLNGGVNCRNATNGGLCSGLGWAQHNTKNTTNNMAQALKLPLSGYRVGSIFTDRGYFTFLWSSTPSSTNAYDRRLLSDEYTVSRYSISQALGGSVRCLKD